MVRGSGRIRSSSYMKGEAMNYLRKFVCIILAVCAMSTACVCLAGDQSATTEEDAIVQNETVGDASPMTSRIALDTNITENGGSWSQPIGYGSYRVWIDNTTNERMTVKITGGWGEEDHVFIVNAKKNKTYVINSAGWGTHRISFDTPSGAFSGTARVRVSDTALS